MTLDKKKVDDYVKSLQEQLKTSPDTMGAYEKRMLTRYNEASLQAVSLDNNVRRWQSQIQQANQNIATAEIQYADHKGQAAAFLEGIIARKFEDDLVSNGLDPDKTEDPKKATTVTSTHDKTPAKKKKPVGRGRGSNAANSKSAPSPA